LPSGDHVVAEESPTPDEAIAADEPAVQDESGISEADAQAD
jgi:hypothetical protein